MAGERLRVIKSALIVTNPSGESHKQEVELGYNFGNPELVEVVVGSGVLKGYTITLVKSEIVRARDHGTPMHEMPIIH